MLRTRLATLAFAALAVAVLTPTAGRAVTVEVTVGPGNSFSPADVTIQAGDSVRWVSAGGSHNVAADDGSFTSGAPGSGWNFTRAFPAAGTFPYYCEVHGAPGGLGMSGSVTVQAGGGGVPGALRFALASSSISEAGGAATISVQRVGGDDGAVSVAFATANGSAQAGSDYVAASGTLNWADNDDNPKTFQVTILDDASDEANETVQLSLSNPGGDASLGSPFAATLTIQDNDDAGGSPGTLRLSSASYSASESAASATLSVTRDGGTTGAVSAGWATADGSALAGSDYVAASGTVNFGAGDGAAKTIEVPLIDDGAEEAPEAFTVALSAPGGGASLGSPSSATVTLTDDDFPTVCVEDEHTLCLNNARFRVRTTWSDFSGGSGQAFALPYTADSGFFYFFDAANLEILLKVLNACDPFQRYWVYYAAASNVEYRIEVVDTHAAQVKVYFNPAGTYAPATGDTDAFATCP